MTKRRSTGSRPGEDPVVREVRAVRRRLWEEGGRTVSGYFRRMEDMSKNRSERSAPTVRVKKSA
jgi:hypothetical protein